MVKWCDGDLELYAPPEDRIDFTTCFEDSVILMIPSAFLYIFGLSRMYYLYHDTPIQILNNSYLYLAKMASIVVGIISLVIMLLKEFVDDSDGFSLLVTIAILIATTFFSGVLLYIEHNGGNRTSHVLSIYWILAFSGAGIKLRTIFLIGFSDSDSDGTFENTFFLIYSISLFSLVLMSCFSEPAGLFYNLNTQSESPEAYAPLISTVSFSWMDPLMKTGYQRPLVFEDLYPLLAKDEPKIIEQKLSDDWEFEKKKRDENGETGEYVTFTKALWRSFGFRLFIIAGFFKFIQDCMAFISPMLLGALIDFTSDDNDDEWKGYLYIGLLSGTALIQSISLHQYFHLVFTSGMRIKSGVIGLVFRKAFRLSSRARQLSTTGEIVNLMSIDAQRLGDICNYINILWSGPWQIILALYFLFNLLGVSVLAGVFVMLLMIPITTRISKAVKEVQVDQMKVKDERIKTMNEALSGIKVIKLYAWEQSFIQKISEIREQELHHLQRSKYINCYTTFAWKASPLIVSVSTFTVYVLLGNELTPEKAFVALSLFNLLQFPLSMFPTVISSVMEASVSVKRLQRYMLNEELDQSAVHFSKNTDVDELVKIENASFSWGSEPIESNNQTSSSTRPASSRPTSITSRPDEEERLLSTNIQDPSPSSLMIESDYEDDVNNHTLNNSVIRNLNLRVRRGELIAIVGKVGSGKSSLLNAILGEMYRLHGEIDVIGSIASVPQQAWIQNATIRDNILFGKELNSLEYNSVISRCQLLPDLKILPSGDQTEIGERGINLSGGQKQRVSIARAVYQNADIYLFDDPLSALDSHVGKALYDEVIGPRGALSNKVRIFATNHLQYLPDCSQIIVLDHGNVHLKGDYQTLINGENDFSRLLNEIKQERKEEEEEEENDENMLTKSMEERNKEKERLLQNVQQTPIVEKKDQEKKDKLMTVETTQTGSMDFGVYKIYCELSGWLLVFGVLLFNAISQASSIGSSVWLSYWSQQSSDDIDEVDDNIGLYVGIYALLSVLVAVFVTIGTYLLVFSTLNVSVITHNETLVKILRSPMSFFDTTPMGRIVNRFSKDIYGVDESIPTSLRSWLSCLFGVLSIVIVIGYATPLFLIVVIPLTLIYIWIQRYYVSSSRQLKRIESVTRSPIYAHFSETLSGLSSIRAYGKVEEFIEKNTELLRINQQTYYPSISSNRWLATRLEFLGNLIVLSASLFAVLEKDKIDSGTVGLSISYALSVTQTLNWFVRMNSEIETNIVSVERLKEYMELEVEAPPITDLRPEPQWPQNGKILFENISLRYRPGTPIILNDLSFSIEGGEKIGICGRTGAGKSSLTLALFRIVELESGRIFIDDVNIRHMGLDDLRSRLTIIPQDPVLFGGTVRSNLDPFESYSDEQIWTALEQAHLKEEISGLDFGLKSVVVEGGDNFSVGQRQLLCLARALLRKTKILILDEATAAVDPQTDELIQQTIRTCFSDCTILTIAHRLNTIMDSDRILVLNRGSLAEFDSPSRLLENKASIFYSMAKDAAIV